MVHRQQKIVSLREVDQCVEHADSRGIWGMFQIACTEVELEASWHRTYIKNVQSSVDALERYVTF